MLLNRLKDALYKQINALPNPNDVVIFVNEDQGQKKLGTKRNELIEEAKKVKALSIAFFDDDDVPGNKYVSRTVEGMNAGYDCCSLWGNIYFHGIKGKPFHHSLIHKVWSEDEKYYYRCPNHLNAIRLDLVKDIPFHPQNFGEDGRWSMAIQQMGLLKTEFQINEVIYHYFTGRKNPELEAQHIQEILNQ